jgi:transcriptional regulator with XRE-family HTH domain
MSEFAQAGARRMVDHPPTVTQTTKQHLLRKAAGLMGKEELAARLNVSELLLEKWIGGDAPMPDRKLLKLANVLDAWVGSQTKQQ